MSSHVQSYDYSQFVNLKDSKVHEQPQFKHLYKKRFSKSNAFQHHIHQKSKLLQTAVSGIRKKHQRQQSDAIEDYLSQSSSNFIFSRENTPVNPVVQKKRTKNLRTVSSDLYEIESEGSLKEDNDEQIFEQLVMENRMSGLSDAVYICAIGKERKVSEKLLHNWKECLFHEDKTEIYGDDAKYTHPKIFAINQLEKGFDQIYGKGKRRCLKIGEESSFIYNTEKYLEKCNKDPKKITRKPFDIIKEILKNAKLSELEHYPFCLKQVELFWKALATRWRYSGKLDTKEKHMENALAMAKNNFLELKKDTPLNSFLLAHSNYKNLLKKDKRD